MASSLRAFQAGPGRGNYDRTRTKEQRHEERHVRLLRAAAEVFAEEGRRGATLAKIVKQAGVGRKTFYEHFDDMHHCLVSVYEYAIEVVFRDVGARLSQIDDPLVRHSLADLAVEVEVSRLISYEIAWLQGQGQVPNKEASMGKLFGTELQQRMLP